MRTIRAFLSNALINCIGTLKGTTNSNFLFCGLQLQVNTEICIVVIGLGVNVSGVVGVVKRSRTSLIRDPDRVRFGFKYMFTPWLFAFARVELCHDSKDNGRH